ncbi:MAG TPA: L,D-transpeptidase [Chloroflexota bacterium]
MPVRQTLHMVWRVLGVPLRRRRRRAHRSQRPWQQSEFGRVNAQAGIEPVQPELSGLGVRYPAGFPRRVSQLLIQLRYRWRPSEEYRRRQAEMRRMNGDLRLHPRQPAVPPPILVYPEENEVAPSRVKPLIDGGTEHLLPDDLPLDLARLEAVERARRPVVIGPRLREADAEDLLEYHHILPKQYRRFLRTSPYPRLAAALTAALTAAVTTLWVAQTQQAEAVAARQLHVARHAFRAELDGALTYGVDPRVIHPLEQRARLLDEQAAPPALVAGRAQFYRREEHAYRALRKLLRGLERRALAYWSAQEAQAHAALVEATRELGASGLRGPLPALPGCVTPACERRAVAGQRAQAAHARQTAATLRVYAAPFSAAPDPAAAAGLELQEVHALRALVPSSVRAPARLPDLDGMIATTTDAAGYARVGALAHLDVDALLANLVARLPTKAILISTEEGQMICYERRRAVCHSVVTALSPPAGVFTIRDKRTAIPALLWEGTARYVDGALPDWMPFTAEDALQGAPWRTVFGPGSESAQLRYAPITPGSVDLPPAVAQTIFGWAAIGTEVVVY